MTSDVCPHVVRERVQTLADDDGLILQPQLLDDVEATCVACACPHEDDDVIVNKFLPQLEKGDRAERLLWKPEGDAAGTGQSRVLPRNLFAPVGSLLTATSSKTSSTSPTCHRRKRSPPSGNGSGFAGTSVGGSAGSRRKRTSVPNFVFVEVRHRGFFRVPMRSSHAIPNALFTLLVDSLCLLSCSRRGL